MRTRGMVGMVDSLSEHSEKPSLTEREVEDIEERTQLRTPVVYEVVRRQGEEELSRPLTSLWWSGLAAGLSISFSLVAQATLRVRIGDVDWRPLIESMGYPVGFLMVILSRQQLFTENTITVVLPVIHRPSAQNLLRLMRLWCVVFLANMAGTLIAAAFCNFAPALPPQTREAMLEISREMMANPFAHMFFRGIASGFLIATMAWAIPSADTAKFHIIALMTYLIAIGGFTHVVAGSVEAFLLLMNGEVSFSTVLIQFILPVLGGNVVGGTVLFSLISYAQVMNEI